MTTELRGVLEPPLDGIGKQCDQCLNRHRDGNKQMAISVRCVRH